MRMMGRELSRWWLLLLCVPFALPLLLGGLFLGNDLAGAIVGPPAIWHRPSHTPPLEDLIGDYVESERHLDSVMGTAVATLSLRADGTMSVRGIPVDEYPTYCILSGEGRWGLVNDGDAKVDLYLMSLADGGTCKLGQYGDFELGSRSKPFKLYWVVGDPDSGTGVWLVRK
jgi:hypothetical protein